MSAAPLRVFIVAGEESGDQLGAPLMRALQAGGPCEFAGVGGAAMQAEGLSSLFPLADIAVMGFIPVLKRLPTLLARIDATAKAALAFMPDVLVIIDSPDFTHRVARKVRAARPDLPIVDYVCPSVWAWRPKRAPKMRAYVDHVLCLLPFEPDALARLGGPPGTYVGHSLVERAAALTPDAEERAARDAAPSTVLILPGSRRSELDRLLPVFRDALAALVDAKGPVDAILPAVAKHRAAIAAAIESWPIRPRLVEGEAAKYAAFRRARAALAASGTVTLELALAGVPSVVAYKVSRLEEAIARRLVIVPSIVLPNLILGENVYPEFIQSDCRADSLARAMADLLDDGSARAAQRAGLARVAERLAPPGGRAPAARAAAIVRALAEGGRAAIVEGRA
ncbi:MAG: lipid-A-disaccharide synthase [Methylobacteriaceae bacterium]|nr:lipid-A-disaccharide synthase [Methylobacteriaceae bacterium]